LRLFVYFSAALKQTDGSTTLKMRPSKTIRDFISLLRASNGRENNIKRFRNKIGRAQAALFALL
jgi:hypothetical protein